MSLDLKELRRQFAEKMEESSRVQKALQAIMEDKGTYVTAEEYAYEVGTVLAEVFSENFSTSALPNGSFTKELAEELIRPLLHDEYELVNQATMAVQKALNGKAKIHLKAQTAAFNADRVDGLIDKIVAAEQYDDVSWVLKEPVKNFSQSVVSDIMKANVEFHGKARLSPKIIRKAEYKCCKWCSELEGVYEYPDVPEDVYRRHERCRCTVDYDPGDGKKYQNVHTKQWQTAEERAKLESRKQLGLKSVAQQLSEYPKRLASYSPSSLKVALEQDGFEVKPLKQGSLKNVTFEEGGGFKVNFEDGGLLQYHPAKNSHHGGAYYKISTGKGGTHWYELDGTEKKEKK